MKLVDEFKAERARIDYCLKAAGIQREWLSFQTHLRHAWQAFWHAMYNVFILPPLKETTVPGDNFRYYTNNKVSGRL